MVYFHNIPVLMRELNNWVLWTKDKVPHQLNGKMAKSNDPTTWTSFSNVLKTFDPQKYEGIGFMFTGSGITGIDIDHCIENGQISLFAQEIIRMCKSYTEKSPSGTGIHIYIQGEIPSGIKKEIEIYSEGRYFTVTGDRLNDLNIEPRQNVLDQLYKKYKKTILVDNECYSISRNLIETPYYEDYQILQLAFNDVKNGTKIKALYDGDISLHNNDHSSADLALCFYLALWLDRDYDRIDRAFKNSKLYRKKWDRQDYSANTINKAISSCNERYGYDYSPKNFVDDKKIRLNKSIYITKTTSNLVQKETINNSKLELELFNIEQEELEREREINGLYILEDLRLFERQYRTISKEYDDDFIDLESIKFHDDFYNLTLSINHNQYSLNNPKEFLKQNEYLGSDSLFFSEILNDDSMFINKNKLERLIESYSIYPDLSLEDDYVYVVEIEEIEFDRTEMISEIGEFDSTVGIDRIEAVEEQRYKLTTMEEEFSSESTEYEDDLIHSVERNDQGRRKIETDAESLQLQINTLQLELSHMKDKLVKLEEEKRLSQNNKETVSWWRRLLGKWL